VSADSGAPRGLRGAHEPSGTAPLNPCRCWRIAPVRLPRVPRAASIAQTMSASVIGSTVRAPTILQEPRSATVAREPSPAQCGGQCCRSRSDGRRSRGEVLADEVRNWCVLLAPGGARTALRGGGAGPELAHEPFCSLVAHAPAAAAEPDPRSVRRCAGGNRPDLAMQPGPDGVGTSGDSGNARRPRRLMHYPHPHRLHPGKAP